MRKVKHSKPMVLMLIAATLLAMAAGCSTQKETGQPSGEEPKKQPMAIVIATGSVTGTYYPIGGAIANIINNNVENVTATVESTGGSVANIRMINNGEVLLGIVGSSSSHLVYNGMPPYEKEPAKNIRAIGALFPETYQAIVRKDSGMATVSDLKGKKVGVGAAGSGTEVIGKEILKEHGITYEDMKPEYLSFSECVTALQDKNIDCGVIFAGAPTASVMDIATSIDINILDLSPDLLNDKARLEEFLKNNPYFSMVTLPAGMYKGVEREVKTVATPCLLATSADADEELIYQITKSMYENLAEIEKAHAQGKNIKLETALDGVPIPLHPGAERYFKEAGLLK